MSGMPDTLSVEVAAGSNAVGRFLLAAWPLAVAATLVAACGSAPEINGAGDIPDNQVYSPFTPPDNLFTVSVPEGWSRGESGTATTFTDKFNTIRIDAVARAAAPTVESARAEELPNIESATRGYVPGSVGTVERRAGQAVLITYLQTSDPSPVTGKAVTEATERYEFWHDGHEVIVTLSGAQGADNVDPWRAVTDSVRWP